MKGLEPQDGTSAATRLVNGEPSPSIESRQQSSPRCACVVPPVSWTVDGGTQAARAALRERSARVWSGVWAPRF